MHEALPNISPVENTRIQSIYLQNQCSRPLFRHSDITAHLITEQITVKDDPGFQNEC